MPRLQFISIEDLLEMKANNEKVKLVEVLSEEDFMEGHIPGPSIFLSINWKLWRRII